MNEDEMATRLVNVESEARKQAWAIWGFQGNNGIVGELKAIRRMIEDREARDLEREENERLERKRDRRWWAGIGITLIVALLGAAQMVAGA